MNNSKGIKNRGKFVKNIKSTKTEPVTKKSAEPVVKPNTGKPGLLIPDDMNFVSKRWGWELWIVNNDAYCGKKLFIKQSKFLSYHHHQIKDEVLYLESGRAIFTHNNTEDKQPISIEMRPGYGYHVTPGIIHQIEAIEDSVFFEFSTKHMDEDSYRKTMDLVQSEDLEDCRFYFEDEEK